MGKLVRGLLLGVAGGCLCTMAAQAQDKPEVELKADVVSAYMWRGQSPSGVSIQPEVSVSWKGVYLAAWGSVGIDNEDPKEIDLTLGYEWNGFSVSVTDYWIDGTSGFFHYGATNTGHTLEAQVGYDFDFLAVNWYTNFAGSDGVNAHDRRAYSSFVSLSAPFRLGGLDWEAEVGATPWTTDFYNEGSTGFAVSQLSLKATKEIRFSSSFSLPLFAQLMFNPTTEAARMIVGVTF